ncbi:hypothetical protein [Aphanizomenon flos-aquae]|uniref:hypothetical protein n=1 Tax=Aphanizomenon flos-aquae TaxID=1176 RepID=UPI001F36EDFB|nr:hypothetical protein [Aphanizomenon flos-aquae]
MLLIALWSIPMKSSAGVNPSMRKVVPEGREPYCEPRISQYRSSIFCPICW